MLHTVSFWNMQVFLIFQFKTIPFAITGMRALKRLQKIKPSNLFYYTLHSNVRNPVTFEPYRSMTYVLVCRLLSRNPGCLPPQYSYHTNYEHKIRIYIYNASMSNEEPPIRSLHEATRQPKHSIGNSELYLQWEYKEVFICRVRGTSRVKI